MDPNFYFPGDMQGDFQTAFQGDFQGFEQNIWAGNDALMMPMMPNNNIDWPMSMNTDAMNIDARLGGMVDWGAESCTTDQWIMSPSPVLNSQTASNAVFAVGLDPAGNANERRSTTAIAADSSPPFSVLEAVQSMDHWFSSTEGPNQHCDLEHVGHESMKGWNRATGSSQNIPATAIKPLANVVPPKLKARVRCSRRGCKLTFRRKYELERHERSVHDRSAAFFCTVYGCNRITKALPRKDHFQSHMRKHQNAHLFVCFFDHCRFSPLTQQELLNHLNSDHRQDKCSTGTEKAYLAYFQWRQTPLRDGLSLFENNRNCPLTFLGCEYKDPAKTFGLNASEAYYRGLKHLHNHELIDRSRGYEAIKKISDGFLVVDGLATCPICQAQLQYYDTFCSHLLDHSKEERLSRATVLAEIFRPFLAGKPGFSRSRDTWLDDMITAELKEAGVIGKADE